MECPKCKKTNLSAQKAGFGLGKAAVGAVLTGGVGLLAGFLGSNKIDVHCLDCGHKWNPAKLAKKEEQERNALKWKRSNEREAARKEMEAIKEEPERKALKWTLSNERAAARKEMEEMEAIKEELERRAIPVADGMEAMFLISRMGIDYDLSDDDNEKLDGYRTALENGTLGEADLRNLQALNARLSERAAERKKAAKLKE